MNRTRLLGLKACGLRAGRATLFWGLPKLTGRGSITSRLQIGDYCGFNDGCLFDLEAPITIGNHVSVGHEVRFLTNLGKEGVETAAPITIGDGVWLGTRCTLLGGVTVGAGSVIGAGVTVTADVPPNTLLTGAKPISLAKWR
jgi:acetyltransferase-like isoleucine patch superfamily enzyme